MGVVLPQMEGLKLAFLGLFRCSCPPWANWECTVLLRMALTSTAAVRSWTLCDKANGTFWVLSLTKFKLVLLN